MASHRILICGEGPHDVGRNEDYLGGLSTLFLRSLEVVANIPQQALQAETVTLRDIKKHGRGWEGKVSGALALANARGYDGCCIACDRDRDASRPKQMLAGRQATRDRGVTLPCALGCAVETLEAWLLGDGATLRNLCPGASCPDHPEALGGGPGQPDHPKTILRSILSQSGQNAGLSYRFLAENLHLEALRRSCPKGYGAFHADIGAEFTV